MAYVVLRDAILQEEGGRGREGEGEGEEEGEEEGRDSEWERLTMHVRLSGQEGSKR